MAPQTLAQKYNTAAKGWQAKIAPLGYPEAYRELVSQLGKSNGKALDILDAGAGCADFSSAFIGAHGKPKSLTLLDISDEMLQEAKRNLGQIDVNAICISGDVESLPPKPRYDIILCAHVIEHCQQPMAALAALRSALRLDGVLLLVASKPHWCTALIRLVWRNATFRPAKMRAMLHVAGFENVKIHGFASGPPSRTSAGFISTFTEEKHDYRDC